MKKFAVFVTIMSIFIPSFYVKGYEFQDQQNSKAVNDMITQIYDARQQYEDLAGEYNRQNTIDIMESYSDSFWWPIGSRETTESAGKLFATGAPESSIITSDYGGRWGSFHNAIDIAGGTVEKGKTNIIAAQSGTVIAVVDQYGDGALSDAYLNRANYVIIQHSNGMITKYWHVHKGTITVKKGESVKQGQVIAKLGNSGKSTGAHLHFEIVDANGQNVNPNEYVSLKNPRPVDSSNSRLIALLNHLEGSTPVSGNSYVVVNIGDGVRTAGHGVTLENNPQRFKQYGIDIKDYPVGSKIDKDIVDKIQGQIVEEMKQRIEKNLSSNGVTLTNTQLDALVVRTYQAGNWNGFVNNYKKYGATLDLYNNWWNNARPGSKFYKGLTNRRNNEWKLFYEGIYVNEQ